MRLPQRITAWQLVLTLFVSRMFSVMTYTPMYSERAEVTAMFLGGLLSSFLTLIILIPMFFLFGKRQEKHDIISIATEKNKILGMIVGYCYAVGILLGAISTLVNFNFFMNNAITNTIKTPMVLIVLFFCALYAVYLGLEGLVRMSSMFFFILLLSLICVFFFSFNRIEMVHFKPVVNEPVKTILNIAWQDANRTGEMAVLIILFPHAKGTFKSAAVKYIVLSGLGLAFVAFMTAAVLGDYMFMEVFPFFTIASVVNLESVRRLDALYMMIWSVAALIRVTLYLFTSKKVLERMLPMKAKRLSGLITGALALGISLWVSSSIQYTSVVSNFLENGMVLLLLILVLPIVVLLFPKAKGKVRGGSQS